MSGKLEVQRSGWLLAVMIALAACGPKTVEDLTTAEGLAGMLSEAGAIVESSDTAPPQSFDAQAARSLEVNREPVYVFEYALAGEAQAIAQRLSEAEEPLPWEGRVSIWSAGRLLVVYPGTDGGVQLLLGGLLGDPLTALPEGPEEPYPPAVPAAIAAWAEAQGLDPSSVEVISYLPAEWSNGCLGLPGPDESCAPGTVSGWIVELRTGDQLGTAHTDDLGQQVRLMPSAGG
jgi:hypothetical protein